MKSRSQFFQRFFLVRSLVPLCWRDWFFTKNPCTGDFSKTPVLEEIDFFLKNPYRENNIPVVGSVLCGVWRLWKFSKFPGVWALCCVLGLWKFSKFSGVWALWCVETLKIFKVPWCVGFVLCGDFENFQSSPVCGLCTVWCVETLKIFIVPWCVGLWNFSKFPCVWDFVPVLERLSFHKKSLYWGFSPVLERLVFSGQKSLCWGFFPGGGALRH